MGDIVQGCMQEPHTSIIYNRGHKALPKELIYV